MQDQDPTPSPEAAFQWESKRDSLQNKLREIIAVRTEDSRRAATPSEKGKATGFFQRCTPESHIPNPLNCLRKKLNLISKVLG